MISINLSQKNLIQLLQEQEQNPYLILSNENIMEQLDLESLLNQSLDNLQNLNLQEIYLVALIYVNAFQNFFSGKKQKNQNEIFQLKYVQLIKSLKQMAVSMAGTEVAQKLCYYLYCYIETLKTKLNEIEIKSISIDYKEFSQNLIQGFPKFLDDYIKQKNKDEIQLEFKLGIQQGMKQFQKNMDINLVFTTDDCLNVLEIIGDDILYQIQDQLNNDDDDNIEIDFNNNNEEEGLNQKNNDKNDEEEKQPQQSSQQQLIFNKDNEETGEQDQSLTQQQSQILQNKKKKEYQEVKMNIDLNALSNDEKKKILHSTKSLIDFLILISPRSNMRTLIQEEFISKYKLDPLVINLDREYFLNKENFIINYQIPNIYECILKSTKYKKFAIKLFKAILQYTSLLDQEYVEKILVCLVRQYEYLSEKQHFIQKIFYQFFETLSPDLKFSTSKEEIQHFIFKIQTEHKDFEFLEFISKQPQLETILELKYDLTFYQNLEIKNGHQQFIQLVSGKQGVMQRVIDVSKAFSVINFSFDVLQYDITFEVRYMGPFARNTSQYQGLTVLKQDKIKCSEEPFKGNLLAIKSGIYIAIFSNQYSWFNEKALKFRISVLDSADIKDNDKHCYEIRKILYPNFIKTYCFQEEINPLLKIQKFTTSPFRAIFYIVSHDACKFTCITKNKISEILLEKVDFDKDLSSRVLIKLLECIKMAYQTANIKSYLTEQKSFLDFIIIYRSQSIYEKNIKEKSGFQKRLKEIIGNETLKVQLFEDHVLQARMIYQLQGQIQQKHFRRFMFLGACNKQIFYIENIEQLKFRDVLIDKYKKFMGPQYPEQNLIVLANFVINITLLNFSEKIEIYFINVDEFQEIDNINEQFKEKFHEIALNYQERGEIQFIPEVQILLYNQNLKLEEL